MRASPRELLHALRATDASVIAVAGCSKNAGKTTAMNILTAEWRSFGLMSIGIDGEDADFWLGVPKPRIAAAAGTVFATADRTLGAATARYEILQRTGTVTPLGELVVARAVEPGMLLLAGIRHKADVLEIRDRMRSLGVDRIVIDGAYQRLMSADPAISDGMILATGAILGGTADEVAVRTMEFVDRIRLPQVTDQWLAAMIEDASGAGRAVAVDHESNRLEAAQPGPGGAIELVRKLGSSAAFVAIPGSMPAGFTSAMEKIDGRGGSGPGNGSITFIVQDPTRVFLGTPELRWLARRGHKIAVARKIRLMAIAVNPVNIIGGTIPSDELVSAIENRICDVPVLDFALAAGTCPHLAERSHG